MASAWFPGKLIREGLIVPRGDNPVSDARALKFQSILAERTGQFVGGVVGDMVQGTIQDRLKDIEARRRERFGIAPVEEVEKIVEG